MYFHANIFYQNLTCMYFLFYLLTVGKVKIYSLRNENQEKRPLLILDMSVSTFGQFTLGRELPVSIE
jgi:hypothetical protein